MATVYVYGARSQHFQPIRDYPALNIATFPLFFGNAAFLFCVHSVVCVDNQHSMPNRTDTEPTNQPTNQPTRYCRTKVK
jgi:hypothetical protein